MLSRITLIFISLFSVVFAQVDNNATLFTIANQNVKVDEFVRVYTKNNINNQADFSKKSLDEYLDLYEKFRLKVKEAETLGMDTMPSFKNELASYRAQLTQSYLSDRKATENLMKEAYDRMQEEIDVSHILIFWPNPNPSKADSLKVLNEIKKIKADAEKTSFEEQISKYNKNTKPQYIGNKQKYEGGHLGYISVFQTVYPFENAMYNTKVGAISEPVATNFGYHLVYVKDKRPTRGKIKTAQILVKTKETDSPQNQEKAKEKAFQIYKEIKDGAISFEDAVKKYSEDRKTKYKKGELPLLSSAEMIESYADASFALKNDGDISEPIKSKIGWHIIKRLKKEELKSFDEIKLGLQKRIEKDSRSNVAKKLMINDTKAKFGFSENEYAVNNLKQAMINNLGKNLNAKDYNETLFTIGKNQVKQSDFIKWFGHSRSNSAKALEIQFNNKYTLFKNSTITKYREDHLEEIDTEFKNLMKEYHDGILLFELTNKEVWTKAVEDTTGLKEYFDNNRDKYIWKDRIVYTNYIAKDAKTASKIKKYLAKGKSKDFILSKLNKKEQTVTAKTKTEEKNSNDFVKSISWTKGTIAEENNLDGSSKISYVENILKPVKKELKETRGYVISDYQDFLENKWIKKLKTKYPIVLNKEVFNSLIK